MYHKLSLEVWIELAGIHANSSYRDTALSRTANIPINDIFLHLTIAGFLFKQMWLLAREAFNAAFLIETEAMGEFEQLLVF